MFSNCETTLNGRVHDVFAAMCGLSSALIYCTIGLDLSSSRFRFLAVPDSLVRMDRIS